MLMRKEKMMQTEMLSCRSESEALCQGRIQHHSHFWALYGGIVLFICSRYHVGLSKARRMSTVCCGV